MNALIAAVTLAIVALASADSPCSKVCNGYCDATSQSINVYYPQFSALLAPNIEACKNTCDTVCNCTDGCVAECQPSYDDCVKQAKEDYNSLALAECQTKYAVCSGSCNLKCSVTVTSGAIQTFAQMYKNYLGSFTQAFDLSKLFGGAFDMSSLFGQPLDLGSLFNVPKAQ